MIRLESDKRGRAMLVVAICVNRVITSYFLLKRIEVLYRSLAIATSKFYAFTKLEHNKIEKTVFPKNPSKFILK